MTMYALHLTRSGLAEQASLPIVIPVLSPNRSGPIVVKENIGEGARQGDEETTADDPGESELTEQSSVPKVRRAEKKPPSRRRGIPKNAAIVVLSEPRSKPCDRCKAQKWPCMPRSKGGELLEACEGCYTRKLSCQTGGRGGRSQKVMEKRGTKKPRNSSESNEESNVSGK